MIFRGSNDRGVMLWWISILFSSSLTIPILSLAIYLFILFLRFQSFETEKILYIDGTSQLTTRSLKYLACSSIAFRSLFPSIPIFYSLLIHLTNCNAFLLKSMSFSVKISFRNCPPGLIPKIGDASFLNDAGLREKVSSFAVDCSLSMNKPGYVCT